MPQLHGSITIIGEGFDKYSIIISINKISQLVLLPYSKTVNSFIVCKLKTEKQFIKKKTKVVENNKNPLINETIKFSGLTNLENSYILFIVKEKTTNRAKKKKRQHIYGTVRIGATSFCRDEEKSIWQQILYNAKVQKVADIGFILPIITIEDMDFQSGFLLNPTSNDSFEESTLSSASFIPENKVNLSNLKDEDLIIYSPVKVQGYLSFNLFYDTETFILKINLKGLFIEKLDFSSDCVESKFLIKCKLLPQEFASKMSSFKLKSSETNIIEWDETISFPIKQINLSKYQVCLRILRNNMNSSFSNSNELELCGSVQFLLKDVLNFFPEFVTNEIKCHMKIHQNVLFIFYILLLFF